MPQTFLPPRRSSNALPSERELASSNSTANAFLGGRQPAWMQGAKPMRPSPRPPPPNADKPTNGEHMGYTGVVLPSTFMTQQIQPATSSINPGLVLPSPAPSDEPSPAGPSPHQSPNQHSMHSPRMQNTESGQRRRSSLRGLPMNEARFVADTDLPVTLAAGFSARQSSRPANITSQPLTTTPAQLRSIEQPPQASPLMSPASFSRSPPIPPRESAGQTTNGSLGQSGRDNGSGSDSRPDKRRRVE